LYFVIESARQGATDDVRLSASSQARLIEGGGSMRRRNYRIRLAWATGWAIYMVAVALWSYDGLPSLILQPFCAAIVSTIFVGAVLLAGLVLRVPVVGRLWHSQREWAVALAAACLIVMCFGSTVGLTEVFVDPETGQRFEALHSVAALATYLLLLFTIAHWPTGRAHGQGKVLMPQSDL
jgi:hypothetical protein